MKYLNKILCLCVLLSCVGENTFAQSIKAAAEQKNKAVSKNQDGNITLSVEGVSLSMTKVKGGSFSMGATKEQDAFDRDEKPVHTIVLKDFYIGTYEVTQQLWEAVMGTTVAQQRDKANKLYPLRGEGANYPMYYVSFDDIQEFLLKLNSITGRNFSLPTEAQWEYAARGGQKATSTKFSGDNELDNVGWFSGNSSETNHEVGTKAANELGIYDMSGNVWEWCADWYAIDTYKAKGNVNPKGPDFGEDVVLRGGSIITDENSCRVSNRGHMNPSFRNSFTGFRLVLENE